MIGKVPIECASDDTPAPAAQTLPKPTIVLFPSPFIFPQPSPEPVPSPSPSPTSPTPSPQASAAKSPTPSPKSSPTTSQTPQFSPVILGATQNQINSSPLPSSSPSQESKTADSKTKVAAILTGSGALLIGLSVGSYLFYKRTLSAKSSQNFEKEIEEKNEPKDS